MPFADANSQLEPLLFQMKQYKNLTKSTIEILPSSGQTSYGPNNKCIFTLPYASLISLEDLALHFEFEGISSKTSVDNLDVFRISPPKDVASLISEIDIKINGQTIQHLTNYNDIVNLLNVFEEAKTAKKALQGLNPTKIKVEATSGVFALVDGTDFKAAEKTNNIKKEYVINHWYGLLGHRGKEVSSNFLDTNMLGEVTIAFTFAQANVCIGAAAANETAVKTAGGSASAGVTSAVVTAAQADKSSTYKLSALKMSMVRYNLPMEYSEALRSNLSGGAKYQIAFNHYENHSEVASKPGGTIRWNENSKDIKGLLAYFTHSNRADNIVPSLYDAKVESSKYFLYDNSIHDNSQFQIGSVKMPQNALNNTACFLELTRGIAGARGNNVEFYNKIQTVEDFLESYFMAYLSLEMTEGMTTDARDGKKLLSGLSSENLPITCSYTYKNQVSAFSGGSYVWNKNVNVLTLSTRLLVIENGQKCYVEI